MTEMHHADSSAYLDAAAAAVRQGLEARIAATGSRIAALQRQLDEALAEAGRARRRAAIELAQARSVGHQELALALLPFRDALEAALTIRTDDAPALRAGLELASRQLDAALARARC